MKVIKSVAINNRFTISIRYISVDKFSFYLNEQVIKTGTYNEMDIEFCNTVQVLLEK